LDGFGNLTYSPVVDTGGASAGASVIPLSKGTMGITVPVGSHVTFAGDATKYEVTARVVDAVGQDEIQSAAQIASVSGNFTYDITLPGNTVVSTGNIAFDATGATVQTAVDAALAGLVVNGVTYTAGDLAVTGGAINAGAHTFTFSGASVDKLDITTQITSTDVDLSDSTPPVMSTTTNGAEAGSTDSVTITPVLVTTLTGGEAVTFAPIELEIKLGEGNFTYDENREVEYIRDRGRLDTYREGDEQPLDVAFDFTWEFIKAISGSGTPTIEEALKNTGEASTWTSSNTSDPCAPYVVDIEIINAPNCAGILAEVIKLPLFFYTQLAHDSDAASVSVTGQCNVTDAVITRTADPGL
jgi:hypothetical protein